jgi:hypothetical protein
LCGRLYMRGGGGGGGGDGGEKYIDNFSKKNLKGA